MGGTLVAVDRRPLTSSHWGMYEVETGPDGKPVALHPFDRDADPSPIGDGIIDVLDGPTRITAPMVRQSWLEHGPGAAPDRRGAEPFVQVTWDQANKLVARELERVRSEFGNDAIYAGSYGWASAGRFHHAQSHLRRFLNCIGGHSFSVNTYSFAAGEVIVPYVLGDFRHYVYGATSWDSIAEHTDLFVAFGGVPLKNGQISQGGVGSHNQRAGMERAIDGGVQFVNVSPLRSDVLDRADAQWVAARPSTDAALMFGLAHTLVDEQLHATDFLDRYTVGFEPFAAYLAGKSDGVEKTAEWASSITGVPAEDIRDLARRMASSRTMISVSWSLTRQDHGEQPFWAAITLAAMLGQIGLPGGGFGLGYSAMNSVGNLFDRLPAVALPQGPNPVRSFIPVARISDMLLHPGEEFDYDGGRYTYPEAKVVWWAGGNPFHHHQDLNRMLEAWRRPDTIIANEWSWNAYAKHADIVLPCTTTLERSDIAMSNLDPFVSVMTKAAEPAGESRDDYAIFAGIAEELDVLEAYTEGRSADEWIAWLYEETRDRSAAMGFDLPPLAELQESGWFELDSPSAPRIVLEDFRADPDAHPLRTPSGRIEIFSETVAGYGYDDCLGHPAWFEPVEWLGAASNAHPLHLISNQPSTKLHSQLDHGRHSRAAKIDGREPVRIHPDDAAARGIATGDPVRVFNERGACLGSAVLDDHVRAGVIQLSTGAWFDPETPGEIGSDCKHGNPNVVTIDKGTSRLAQGPIAHSCLVDVQRIDGPLPAVSAFEPPTIL